MKIAGISASRREWGNTDILVRHALKGAEREGAETRFLRLTDLEIHQCKECLSCLFKGRDCIIRDQLPDLLKILRWADGVVLGSPIHTLFAAGSIQTLVPRLFRLGYTQELAGKAGIAIVVGGRPGWEGWALPQVMIFFLSLGMPIIDRFTGYGQGPGEVFYDVEACERALKSGAAMAMGETAFRGEPGTCPVCHCDLMLAGPDGRPRCMMCEIPGQWKREGEVKRFEPLPGSRSRWGCRENRDHFEKLILPSRHAFQARREAIKKKLELFRKTS